MPDIDRGLRHVVLYETFKTPVNQSLDQYYLLDIVSACYNMQNKTNLMIQN